MMAAIQQLVDACQYIADNSTTYSYDVVVAGAATIEVAGKLEDLLTQMTLACEKSLTKESGK